jgi:SAM-dependent methyltransferase
MSDATLARSYGKVFNEVAVEYDRNRPSYPDVLVDQACELAGIGAGDRVLEIGCGTGQLTRGLLARGLRVTALEPGDRLIAVADENLKGAGDVESGVRGVESGAGDVEFDSGEVEFVHARLEDTELPRESYAAVFSASAIHWVDPDLGWRKIADALAPGGTVALLQYFGLQERRSIDDQQALLSALSKHAPEIAASWPTYRDLDCTIAGMHERRRNIADAWSWLGSYDIGRDYAADLFEDLQLATVPTLVEKTADELNSLLGTMSFWARLSAEQRDALTNENHALQERLGRPIRASTVAVLLTARRSAPASRCKASPAPR